LNINISQAIVTKRLRRGGILIITFISLLSVPVKEGYVLSLFVGLFIRLSVCLWTGISERRGYFYRRDKL